MSTRTTPTAPATRRERRTAQRARGRTSPPPANGPIQRLRRSPVALTTIVAGVIGLVFVAVLMLQNQTPGAGAAIVQPSATTPAALASDRTLGTAGAPVTIDVWSDFQCPYCQQFWTNVEPRLVSTFIQPGTARLVYHDYTFIGPESLNAAIAARCADQQGKFWQYHDLLYANQGVENTGAFSADRLKAMAVSAGLDVNAWTTCLSDPSIATAIQTETQAGQAAGVTGTPTITVNGTKLATFDYPTVAAAITAAAPSASPAATSAVQPSASPAATSPAGASATP